MYEKLEYRSRMNTVHEGLERDGYARRQGTKGRGYEMVAYNSSNMTERGVSVRIDLMFIYN